VVIYDRIVAWREHFSVNLEVRQLHLAGSRSTAAVKQCRVRLVLGEYNVGCLSAFHKLSYLFQRQQTTTNTIIINDDQIDGDLRRVGIKQETTVSL
jgi:hypothetical protein